MTLSIQNIVIAANYDVLRFVKIMWNLLITWNHIVACILLVYDNNTSRYKTMCELFELNILIWKYTWFRSIHLTNDFLQKSLWYLITQEQ